MKRIYILILVFTLFTNLNTYSQIGGVAGSFGRMGFGSRGMGMGNAMSAVTTGEIYSNYNPALVPFSTHRTGSLTFSFLPFDRYLNFLSYGQSIKPTAGISFGIINAGVNNIDSRDNDGFHTEYLSTSENLFFLTFGNRVHKNISLGLSIKLFYHKLYKDVSSTTVGFDIGTLVVVSDAVKVGIVVKDIGSKYKWDTSKIYGQSGGPTKDVFANLRKIGVSYQLPNGLGLAAIEFENTSEKTNTIRVGSEIKIVEYFSIRAGIDRWLYASDTDGIKPSFGFSVNNSFGEWTPALSYAYVVEPFSIGGIHIITLSVNF